MNYKYLSLGVIPALVLCTLHAEEASSLQQEENILVELAEEEDYEDDDALAYDDENEDSADDEVVQAETPASPAAANTAKRSSQNFPGINRENKVFSGQPFPTNSYNCSFYGEFLYVTSAVSDLAYTAYTSMALTTVDRFKTITGKYSPALRIGADYSFSAQGWSLGLDWMRVSQSHVIRDSYPYPSNGTAQILYAAMDSNISQANAAGGQVRAKNNLFFNEGNITASKEIFFTKYFSLRPTASATFVWFNHTFKNGFYNTSQSFSNTQSFKNKYQGFGFKFGGASRFQLGYGLYVLGDGQIGITTGPKDVRQPMADTNDPLLMRIEKMHSTTYLPMIEAKMELGWRRSFFKEKFGVDSYIGYEYHSFLNAVQILQSASYISNNYVIASQSKNLGIQGMNVGLKFHF